jgi:hypothetical protein
VDFLGQIELAEDGTFQARVRQAAITAAVAIMADRPANTPQAIAKHALRAKLALDVLRNPSNWARPMAAMVASNVSIDGESPDSDIQWTVNAMWDAISGIVLEPELA